MSENKITCPNCGHSFDVEAVLAHQAEHRIRQEMESNYAGRLKEIDAQKENLVKELETFNIKKKKENELFQQRLKEKLETEMSSEKKKIEQKTREDFELQLKALLEENEKRKQENRELKTNEINLKKRENELNEKTEELEINLQKKLLESQKEIELKARGKERESMALKEKEYIKQLEDQKKLIDEMKRKAEQGSMQMQGEVQELALEELLKTAYPFDRIDEVMKGARGADCIQTVINSRQQVCGTIVYESKRTKAFSNGWIDKLKQDQLLCKADIAVLVTESYPGDMLRFGSKDGVWICGFHEVGSLSFVLREMLLKTQAVKTTEENKGEKAELLYNYLTSNEFVQNIKRITENYDGMIQQLNSEKKAMHKIWASREKQIWVVQENIAALFGSIKGIAGSELEASEVLELPDSNIDE